MGEVIVITSGKGGVGKTTTTANLGAALALRNKKVALVDTDIGLRNLDVVMGLENRIVYDIVDVVEEKCKLRQALIKDKRFNELFLLPAAQTRDKSAINEEQMKELIGKLKDEFDLLINGESIEKIIKPELTYREMDDINNIYSFIRNKSKGLLSSLPVFSRYPAGFRICHHDGFQPVQNRFQYVGKLYGWKLYVQFSLERRRFHLPDKGGPFRLLETAICIILQIQVGIPIRTPMRESSADGLFQDRQMKSMLPGEHPKIIEIFHARVEAPQLHHSLPFFRNQRFFGVTSDRCGWHFRNQGRVLQFHGFGIQVIAKAYIHFHGDLFTLNLGGKLDSKPRV